MNQEDQSASKHSGSITGAPTCVSDKPQEASADSQQAEPQTNGQACLGGLPFFVVAGCW